MKNSHNKSFFSAQMHNNVYLYKKIGVRWNDICDLSDFSKGIPIAEFTKNFAGSNPEYSGSF